VRKRADAPIRAQACKLEWNLNCICAMPNCFVMEHAVRIRVCVSYKFVRLPNTGSPNWPHGSTPAKSMSKSLLDYACTYINHPRSEPITMLRYPSVMWSSSSWKCGSSAQIIEPRNRVSHVKALRNLLICLSPQ
jgi:hypothetical protein